MKPCFPSTTCGHKGQRLRTLRGMVRHYILYKRPRAQDELESFRSRPFEEALERAAQAKDERGKRFSHQTRLEGSQLRKAKNILLDAAKEICRCKSFDDLHNLIKKRLDGIRGLGELYYYDTALRIGASLCLKPKRVYLHRGTRIGTRELGLDCRADSLDPRALPKKLAVLEPREIEDFLCIYKDHLRPDMW
jgi:hypothetical protein